MEVGNVISIKLLSSNDQTKFADWVAYKVSEETIGPSKTPRWKTDPRLDAVETLEPGEPRGANYCDHLTTVNNIENRSGLEFFHALEDDTQERLEGRAATLGKELGCE